MLPLWQLSVSLFLKAYLPPHFCKDITRKANVMNQEQSIFLGKAEQRASDFENKKKIRENVNAK